MKKIILSISVATSLVLADNYIAGGTIANIPINLKKEDVNLNSSIKVENIKHKLIKRVDSIIDDSLQKVLQGINDKKRIEVEIHFDTMIKEEQSLNASFKGRIKDGKDLEELSIQIDDKKFKSFLNKFNKSRQVEILEDKHIDLIKKNRLNRIEKSKKIISKFDFINKKNIINFNENSGVLKASLTKKEIVEISKNNKDILSMSLPTIYKPNLVSAFDSINMNTTSYPVSLYGGHGVGIYMTEAKRYCFEEKKVIPIESLIGLGGGDYTEDRPENIHANQVAQSLRASSPESHIYCSDEKFSLPSSWEKNIHVVNYSFGDENASAIYNFGDKLADKFIYNDNVLAVISSGNAGGLGGGHLTSPAKAHNALTVGAYDDINNRMGWYSSWKNPNTGAIKPEIVAPGGGDTPSTELNFAGMLGNSSGTSFAAPLATGMAASNISLIGGTKHAALVKASMLAMATNYRISDYVTTKLDGARGIQWNPDGVYQWFEKPNSYLNDADGAWMKIASYNLPPEKTVKIAISWLNREEVCDGVIDGSSYPAEPSHLCMDLAFAVTNSSGTAYMGLHTNQNWEAGVFNTVEGGTHDIYVWRTRNLYEVEEHWYGDTYYKNDIKMGIRVAYIENIN